MSQIDLEPINIRRLAIEEPLRSSWDKFDPVRLLTEEDWKEITRFSESALEISYKTELASEIKLIAPQKLSALRIDDYLERIRIALSDITNDNFYVSHLILAVATKQLFQEKVISSSIDENRKQLIKVAVLQTNRPFHINDMFAAYYFKLLYPEESVTSLISKDKWQIIKDELQAYKKAGNWHNVSRYSTAARVILPNRFSELNVTQNDLQKIYGVATNHHRKKQWANFINCAWSLKILTADEVTVDDEGIHVINYPPALLNSQPLPLLRRFR